MFIDISDNVRHFFWHYSQERRLPLYQALVGELVNISSETVLVENIDQLNALKHQLKGICRYLSLEFDAQIEVITRRQQLHCMVEYIHGQVVAIADEL